jgi:hypothetical protein
MPFSHVILFLGVLGIVFGREKPSALAGLFLIGIGAWIGGYF